MGKALPFGTWVRRSKYVWKLARRAKPCAKTERRASRSQGSKPTGLDCDRRFGARGGLAAFWKRYENKSAPECATYRHAGAR